MKLCGKRADHSVEVIASTVNEAACLAIRAFRDNPLVEEVADGAYLEIEVTAPVVRHRVRIENVLAYTQSMGSPRDQAERVRLRAIVEGPHSEPRAEKLDE